MTQPSANDVSDLPEEPLHGSAARFLKMARGFWTGPTRRTALFWSGGALLLILCNLAVNVGLNRWNRWFFDALEKKQGESLLFAVGTLLALIVAGAAFAVAMVKFRMTLQLYWRQWLTGQLTGRWLSEQRYYRLEITNEQGLSPEYRIADDVRLATEPVVDFTIGFINATLSAVTFVGILFVVGGSITIGTATIPGYIALAAVLYALAVSTGTYLVGRPLVRRVAEKNEVEALFRYELTRLRESAESIALIKGDEDERRRVTETFSDVVKRWTKVVNQHCHLTWILNANAFFAGTFPILLATPKYLAGDLTLGAMMQMASAFTAVLGALNWFAENYIRLAEWSASARRVDQLVAALHEIDEVTDPDLAAGIVIENSSDNDLHLDGLSVAHRSGKVVISDAYVSIAPGERVLLGGASGSGKSTLIRAVAGLWPWGSGRILLPPGRKTAFVPQRPYMPLGTLREVLAYPDSGANLTTDVALAALKDAGLAHMARRLDEEDRWSQILSGGERQRVAFARVLLQKPDIIVMDEATAALDVDSEERLLKLLFEHLPDATVLSVGHRPGLEPLHTRKLVLSRHRGAARILASGEEGSSDNKGMRGRVKQLIRSRLERLTKPSAGAALPITS
ncbi:MAG: ABC transporter ATP-binding protein/permease [Hyphomicrobiaceae bacterium]|nr:ABC transporter ATP-binding protein/permease [Hyphomicrobiaceae bacterium]